MMDEREDRLDELIRDAARDYHAPPVTPRAEMWEAIQAGRRSARTTLRPATLRRPLALGLGIAALLALGIGIGRLTVPSREPEPFQQPTVSAAAPIADTGRPASQRPAPRDPVGAVAAQDEKSTTTPASELATGVHLSQAESFLTEFGTRPESDYSAQAQDLLNDTRLLIDSKRVADPRIKRLLEDLELVLTQIATLSREHSGDLDLIAEAVAQRHLRTRLRSVLPPGPAIRS